MRIFVTGATGFLGADLTRRLLASDHFVRILARSPEKAAPLVALGAELVLGEITNQRVLKDALQGIDIIYNLAGKLFDPGESPAEYYRIHLEGVQRLLECCQERSGMMRFIHTSTTGVLGASGNNPQDENAPANPTNAYEDSKWKAEQQVRSAIQRGFPAVIIRPGFVYGPGDLHLLGFFRTIQRGLYRPIGSKPVWLHPIYIEDVTKALMCCGEHPNAIGECFHIAGREPVTLTELANAISHAFGSSLPPGEIPFFLAKAAAIAGDLFPGKLKRLAPLSTSRLDFLTHSRVYDVSKAYHRLGFIAKTPLDKGIAQTVMWYHQQGYL